MGAGRLAVYLSLIVGISLMFWFAGYQTNVGDVMSLFGINKMVDSGGHNSVSLINIQTSQFWVTVFLFWIAGIGVASVAGRALDVTKAVKAAIVMFIAAPIITDIVNILNIVYSQSADVAHLPFYLILLIFGSIMVVAIMELAQYIDSQF